MKRSVAKYDINSAVATLTTGDVIAPDTEDAYVCVTAEYGA